MNYELCITHSVLRHNDIAEKLSHEFPGGILPVVRSRGLLAFAKSMTSAGIPKWSNKINHSDNKSIEYQLITPHFSLLTNHFSLLNVMLSLKGNSLNRRG